MKQETISPIPTQNQESRSRKFIAACALSLGVLSSAACAAPETDALERCANVVNKVDYEYTEYDLARKIWDGSDELKWVTEYKVALSDGRVLSPTGAKEYVSYQIGEQICDTVVVAKGSGMPAVQKPLTPKNAVCEKVTNARVIKESEVDGASLVLGGTIRNGVKAYPMLTTEKSGDIIVDDADTFVLHPVGSEFCFDPLALTKAVNFLQASK